MFGSAVRLRPYQDEAVQTVFDGYALPSPRRVSRPVVQLPTGTGKTVVFAALARQAHARGLTKDVLVLVHRDELVRQAVEKFRTVWPEVKVGVVKGREDETDAQVVVASVQTLCRPERLKRLDPARFNLLICDEAHHGHAPSYKQVFAYFSVWGEHIDPAKLLVGVTATPITKMGEVFQRIVYRRMILEMIREGWLCSLVGLRITTETELKGLRTIRTDYGDEDFDERELARVLNTRNRNEIIVQAWQRYASRRLTVAFTINVAHAHDLAEAFRTAGIRAEAVSGETPFDERRRILQAFHRREIQVICNANVLTEGWDEPQVDCVLMARPTKSKVLYAQQLGRGTRTHPLKRDCLVMDIADNTLDHNLADLTATLQVVPPQPDTDEDRPAPRGRQPFGEAGVGLDVVIIGREIIAETVDLFREAETRARESPFRWFIRGNELRLNLGSEGYLVLVPADDGGELYRAVHRNGDTEDVLTPEPVSITWAQGIAEDWVRTRAPRALSLVRKDAFWRNREPGERQMALLRRYGIDTAEHNLTRGEASDLITLCDLERAGGSDYVGAGRRALARFLASANPPSG